eukprot:TRINITY_DN18641_c0_g1_i1.p1 TRINITY_DN18641_c0_g1~~TRINITY_DN18641_c0_g1_i1.p1  ORF type:complete len:453 (-),score=60.08 TRINITY_DN18641_c0_g1_i1:749-1948(-)
MFLNKMQACHRAGKLCNAEIAQLSKVPGMRSRLQCWGVDCVIEQDQTCIEPARSLETPVKATSGAVSREFGEQCSSEKQSQFDKGYEKLCEWAVRQRGVLPKQNSSDVSEASLAKFLNWAQSRYRVGKLSSSQIGSLRRIPGMRARLEGWKAKRQQQRQANQKETKVSKETFVCPLCHVTFKSKLRLENHRGTEMCKRAALALRPAKPDKLFVWVGNKYTVTKFILRHIPKECVQVVSPFFGSGAVELGLLRERSDTSVVASDLTTSLVRFWEAMIDSPVRVANEVDKLLPTNRNVRKAEFDAWVEAIAQESGSVDHARPEVTAARFYCVNLIAFNGKMNDARYCEADAEKTHRFRDKRLRRLREFVPLEDGRLQVCNRDCFETIQSAPKDALLFLDPP